MSLEKELGRIATALEGLLEIYSGNAKPKSSSKASKPKAEKPKKEETVEEEEVEENDGPSKEDVRAKLTELQTEKGGPAAKALLKKFKATSIGKLKEKDYAKVITEIDALLVEEAEEEDDDGFMDD